MALKLTYMWNIVAKLAKLQKSIFSRGTPTTSATEKYELNKYACVHASVYISRNSS